MALNDDYLSCKSYVGKDRDLKHNEFTVFQDKKTSKYYFAFVDADGDVLLRSEGYVDVASRTKAILSVKKNLEQGDKLDVIEENKKYFVVLKAGNNKEIGRSCPFKSKTAATKALTQFGVKEKPLLSSLDSFLEVNEYLDRPRIYDSYGITGYVKFQAADGKHYFGVYNPDATLYLRSSGYEHEEDRDAAFDLMDSIILLEEQYKIENLDGKYYAVLFEEKEVVAISPGFNSFIEAFVTTPGGRPKEIIGTMY